MFNLSGETTMDKQSFCKASCCLIILAIFESAVPVKARIGIPGKVKLQNCNKLEFVNRKMFQNVLHFTAIFKGQSFLRYFHFN